MAGDPFLQDPSRKRKRAARPQRESKKRQNHDDEEISLDSDLSGSESPLNDNNENLSSDDEFAGESAADKRRRLAQQYLANIREEEADTGDYDAQDLDDDIVARRLRFDAAEAKGQAYKKFADAVEKQLDSPKTSVTRVGSKSVTGVALHWPHMYTVSKDGELVKWRVDGKAHRVRHWRMGSSGTGKAGNTAHTGAINTVAVLPDGRYVVTGGEDARVVIWAADALTPMKALDTRAAVNAVAFRRSANTVYAACRDLRIRTISVDQQAQVEMLYGHQDDIADISALSRETCVSVGSRDRTAMFWKIAEELRLTFRGGDSKSSKNGNFAEGSLDCCSMLDETTFVTGADNGTLALWLLLRKKAVFSERAAHGMRPSISASAASAEADSAISQLQIPPRQPFPITSVHAVPYSDLILSGLCSGKLLLWRMSEDRRTVAKIGEILIRGYIVKIVLAEVNKKVVIHVATSKEPRNGRWEKVPGRSAVTTLTFDI